MAAITIREIATLDEMKAVECLQREVWGVGDLEIVPAYHLKVVHETGGLLIGAYDGAELIGFIYGILGREASEPSIHSDMCAVLPRYRDHNLGYGLKLAQRDWCLNRGVNCVTWTFDPLQSRNANLNFAKLGAVSRRYQINYYGETTSFLHQLGTDRFWMRWLLNSDRVSRRLSAQAPKPSLPADYAPQRAMVWCDESQTPQANETLPSDAVFIEIPGEIGVLQEADRALAVRWREATREAFIRAVAVGCQVEEFHRVQRSGQSVGVYELRVRK